MMIFKKRRLKNPNVWEYSSQYMQNVYDVIVYGGELFYQKNLSGYSCKMAQCENVHTRIIEHFKL